MKIHRLQSACEGTAERSQSLIIQAGFILPLRKNTLNIRKVTNESIQLPNSAHCCNNDAHARAAPI